MVGKNSDIATSIAALLLLLVIASAGPAARSAHAIAVGASPPSWVIPGDYVEYNQTYTIDGLTASISINETFLKAANAEMHLEGFDPQVPPGFPEPGLVSPYDSYSDSAATIVFGNGTTRTLQNAGFSTDLTAFIDQDLVARTNATLDSVQVHALGDHTVQAWQVNETLLYAFIAGQVGPPTSPTSHSYVWFEKNTLMKIRESQNYTDPSNNDYIVSVETLEDTNIPQLMAALTGQEMNSTQSTTTSGIAQSTQSTSALSSTASGIAQSPGYQLEWAVLAVVVVVTVAATASYFARGRHPDSIAASAGEAQICEVKGFAMHRVHCASARDLSQGGGQVGSSLTDK